MTGKETVLVISDLQAPFHHKDAIPFLQAVADKYNPTQIVCIGDEVDFHALSDYDHDPDGWSAGQELKQALKFMHKLYEAFPVVKVCISNHTSRPLRRAKKYGIPKAFMKDYHEFLEAPPGWQWKDLWYIDGVRYEHGDGIGGGGAETAARRAVNKRRESVVVGHFHAGAGVQWSRTKKDMIFGMNVGSLVDHHAYAFAYWKGGSTETIGCGIVERGVPTFVPMPQKKGGRWTKSL